MFWFRAKALKALFAHPWTIEDFPEEPCTASDGTLMHAVERCYPFVAQQAGYYSAWLMSDRFAAMMTTNQYKTLRDITLCVCPKFFYLTYSSLLELLRVKFASFEKYGFVKRVKTAVKVLIGSKNVQRVMLLSAKVKQRRQRVRSKRAAKAYNAMH
jgi:rhamnosyltransferase